MSLRRENKTRGGRLPGLKVLKLSQVSFLQFLSFVTSALETKRKFSHSRCFVVAAGVATVHVQCTSVCVKLSTGLFGGD